MSAEIAVIAWDGRRHAEWQDAVAGARDWLAARPVEA